MSGYIGICICGPVQFKLPGEPFAMLICQCIDCRAQSANPVNGAKAFKRDELAVTKGQDFIKKYNSSEGHDRCWCSKCGGHIFSDHPTFDLIDIHASVLDGIEFKPAVHVNYAQSILPIKDGLPKFKDLPKELGGTSGLMGEQSTIWPKELLSK